MLLRIKQKKFLLFKNVQGAGIPASYFSMISGDNYGRKFKDSDPCGINFRW